MVLRFRGEELSSTPLLCGVAGPELSSGQYVCLGVMLIGILFTGAEARQAVNYSLLARAMWPDHKS